MMQAARPFFLLDWLDDLMVNQDAFQIAELLKTPSKLPRGASNNNSNHCLHAYQSESQIAMTETSSGASSSSSSNSIMLRSISSPQVSCVGTPRSSNCKKINQVSLDHHGVLPTRLFAAASADKAPPSKSHPPPRPPQPFKKRSMALGNGWNAKGLTKAKQGKWEAALACWDNALEIRLQISDPNSRKDQLEVANTWNNRGIALGKLGQYHNAIDALQEALEIRSALLEKGHPQVVSTLHNIANVHQQQGDLTTALQVFGNAKSLLVQAASISSSASSANADVNDTGNNDPMLLARICTAIGHIYYQAQQWIDSRDAYQDALNILLQSSSDEQQQQQQREIYELERDIQELNAKISIAPFFNHGHGHRSPPQQSPQH